MQPRGLAAVWLLLLAWTHGSRAPLPPRRLDHQPEGASLRRMIEQYSLPLTGSDNDGNAVWEVLYDAETGFPYYHHLPTGHVQWDNPFAEAVAASDDDGSVRESWRVYDQFLFRGLFDDLVAVRFRRFLPRTGSARDIMTSIATMAALPFDVAQARLEIAIYKAEQRAGARWAQQQLVTAPAEPIGAGDASTLDGSGDEAERAILEALNADPGDPDAGLTPVRPSFAPGSTSDTGGISEPHASVTVGERIGLSGAWNDLGNMWYARGEWEITMECFRRSLYWNPEQTATLINLMSVLVKLGFEHDAAVVWRYYVAIDGGSMGGWELPREEQLMRSIQRGIDAAAVADLPGLTSGQVLLRAAMEPSTTGVIPVTENADQEQASSTWATTTTVEVATATPPITEHPLPLTPSDGPAATASTAPPITASDEEEEDELTVLNTESDLAPLTVATAVMRGGVNEGSTGGSALREYKRTSSARLDRARRRSRSPSHVASDVPMETALGSIQSHSLTQPPTQHAAEAVTAANSNSAPVFSDSLLASLGTMSKRRAAATTADTVTPRGVALANPKPPPWSKWYDAIAFGVFTGIAVLSIGAHWAQYGHCGWCGGGDTDRRRRNKRAR